jgi:hypothetical protein
MPILLEDEDTIDLCIWFIAPSSSLGRGRGREEGMKDEQTDSEMDRCPNHPCVGPGREPRPIPKGESGKLKSSQIGSGYIRLSQMKSGQVGQLR